MHVVRKYIKFWKKTDDSCDDLIGVVELHKERCLILIMMLVANKVVWVNNKPVAYEIINEYCAEKESMFHFVEFIFNMEES